MITATVKTHTRSNNGNGTEGQCVEERLLGGKGDEAEYVSGQAIWLVYIYWVSKVKSTFFLKHKKSSL